jgi:hypothetical protein
MVGKGYAAVVIEAGEPPAEDENARNNMLLQRASSATAIFGPVLVPVVSRRLNRTGWVLNPWCEQ